MEEPSKSRDELARELSDLRGRLVGLRQFPRGRQPGVGAQAGGPGGAPGPVAGEAEALDLAPPVVMFNQDRDLRYTWVHAPRPLRRIGYVLGRTDADLVEPEAAARVTSIKRRVLDQGVGVRTEVQLMLRGRRYFYDLTVEPLWDGAGRVIGITCAAFDITDRKRIEETLQIQQAREHLLAEAAALLASSLDYETTLSDLAHLLVPHLAEWCCVDVQDEGGRIERLAAAHANPEKEPLLYDLARRYPRSSDARVGYPWVLRTGRPELVPRVSPGWLRSAARDDEHLRVLQEVGLYSYLCVPLACRGRTIGAVSLGAGEPDRYQVADLALLQDLAASAALAVDNARLYREAREAVQLREEFLSIVTHDLKNPLTSIKGFAMSLRRFAARTEGPEGEALREGLGDIEAAAGELQTLVEELLDMSHLQQDRFVLHPEPADLAALARQVMARFEYAPERTAAHTLVLDAPYPVQGTWDPGRLDQVLTNLVSNALKYSPEGGEVRVTLRRWGGTAELAVSDQGRGIPESERENIFRPFTRGVSSARGATGEGLGLYITGQIVERHGGSITVESREGEGSTFTVRLPLQPVEGAREGGSP